MKNGMKVALGIGGLLLVGGAVWYFTRNKAKCPDGCKCDKDGNCIEPLVPQDARPDVTVDDLLNLQSVKDLGITRKDVDEAFPKDNQDTYAADAYGYMNQAI